MTFFKGYHINTVNFAVLTLESSTLIKNIHCIVFIYLFIGQTNKIMVLLRSLGNLEEKSFLGMYKV